MEKDPEQQAELLDLLEDHEEASLIKQDFDEMQRLNSEMIQMSGHPLESEELVETRGWRKKWRRRLRKARRKIKRKLKKTRKSLKRKLKKVGRKLKKLGRKA